MDNVVDFGAAKLRAENNESLDNLKKMIRDYKLLIQLINARVIRKS